MRPRCKHLAYLSRGKLYEDVQLNKGQPTRHQNREAELRLAVCRAEP